MICDLKAIKERAHPSAYVVESASKNSEDRMLKEGSKAPAFAVLDDHGNTVSLKDYAGKSTVVLFFFPKADTPG